MHVERLEPPDGGAGAGRTGRNDGPATLVMIHGMASDSLASWYFTVAKPLADAGLRVLMYDLRGHGHSERPPTGYALDDFVDDLSAMLTELDVAGPVHLLGNSFGGTIAFAYAVHHPDRVASVTAIESSPPTRAWMARVARRLDRAANLLPRPEALAQISAGRGERVARRARATGEMLVTTTLARDLPASALPSSAQISAIGVPVLCLYGANSAVVELAPAVVRLLPQTRTVVLPGEKHTVLIDRPEAVRRLVLAWLREECAVEVAEAATTP
ncbi:alpha/beta fold hydrolase [Micromonospora sp. NBC_01796]|uniref:alpha/beta fold hydrolase n=1 Tax=Micromonospora sp. NBC_01796 TaxID=2975987 RepID=UPI002DDC6CD4|nr:alpha/beta hydrolase [Micromonospora sp. NBC_01796]WSA90082.1 alpha/beta hydrolase [Micromonospora sp. NBC_01796]